MKISVKGFVIGSLFNFACLFLLSVGIAVFAYSQIQGSGGLFELLSDRNRSFASQLSVAIGFSFGLVFFLSGWLTAKISNHSRLCTALLVGLLMSLQAFIPYEDKELEIAVVQFLIPIVFSYLGAKVFLKRANKFKNESAHCVRSDGGKTRRPF